MSGTAPGGGSDYVLDPFDDGSSRLVGVKLSDKFAQFVKSYGEQLHEAEEALDRTGELWEARQDPLALAYTPYEQCRLVQLVRTDNKLFNKIVIVFASLCREMARLKEQGEKKFFAPFLMFEESKEGEGEGQVLVGKVLRERIVELSQWMKRVYLVIQNTVRQLASLYHPQQKLWATSFKPVRLLAVYEQLADLLTTLISLDLLVQNNEAFRHAWAMYKRMTKSIRSEPARYDADDQRLVQFEKLLLSVEGQLFDGLIYQNCVEQEFDFPGLVDVRSNAVFQQDLLANIRDIYTNLAGRLGQKNENGLRPRYIGLCGLWGLYFALYKDASQKQLFKQIFDLHTKAPLVHVGGNAIFMAPEFFIKRMPHLVKTLGTLQVSKFRVDFLKIFDKTFMQQVQDVWLEASVWMVRMESNLTNRAEVRDILSTRVSLLSQGPQLSERAGQLFRTAVHMHLQQGVALRKEMVGGLMQCVETMKAIAETFHRRSAMIGESMQHMTDLIRFHVLRQLVPIRMRLEASGRYSDAKLDVLAALTLVSNVFSSAAPTPERITVARLCMHVLLRPDFVKEEEVDTLRLMLQKLEGLATLSQRVRRTTDASFIYWTRNLIPLHLKHIYANSERAHRLHYLFAALEDAVPLLRGAVYKDGDELVRQYADGIEASLNTHIIERLCRDIETDLRLHIHSHLHVAERDPFRKGLPNLVPLVTLEPLRWLGRRLDIKGQVEHYLDTTFYNLTTVALYDWQTYAEMRNLALVKYGLRLAEVHLPGQTLDQGLDVLEIMRNIHVFVQRYRYNLNNQIFIEGASPNKTIHSIGISHIANSIRTHGTGIMNTTVNFTYQFLRQKFVVFSQFLYDDHIKSRLFKDLRYFRDHRQESRSRYPFARAERFHKEIRKLGLTPQGLSYLDQFRILITEIGNAMGYVRMIRSGGLFFTSNAVKFIPDLQDIHSFRTIITEDTDHPLPEHTQEAAKNLDGAIENLVRNFAEGTEYNKMLVNVFASEFRDKRNAHLQNFYAIVPPLTLNFVHHIMKCKDKLYKKQLDDVTFTDDGFVIGIAYILKLLDQYGHFDSLHWWDAVTDYIEQDKTRVTAEAKSNSKKDKEDLQTLTLTQKKLNALLTEFQLLQFSFTGARIFFKD